MKSSLTFILSLVVFSLYSQEVNRKIIDDKTGEEMLIGTCTKISLKQKPFSTWFETEYERYQLKELDLSKAKQYINDKLKIVVVFGTWCSDTHEQLPRFYKVMDYIGYLPNTIELLAVNRNKEADHVNINTYKLDKIPTFIFYKNGKEIGRIVEKPTSTIENEVFKILKKL